MIGIIGAMDIEIEGLKSLIENTEAEKVSGLEFIKGKIFEKDVVIAKCGCGKVNAALCTEAMILKYNPDVIINTGVAGGLDKRLNIADIAVADFVCQHDYDTTPLGEPRGFLSQIDIIKIPCSKKVCEKLENAAKKLENTTVVTGTVASGDQFLNSMDIKNEIVAEFGAVAGEMEGGAIGHVCYANNVDFGVLRAISDNADGSSHMDFGKFTEIAAAKTISVLTDFIKEF